MKIRELMENKMFKMLAIVIALVVVILLIIVVVMLFKGGRVSNYEALENKLIAAAKSYYQNNDNISKLPAEVGAKIEIDSTTLSSEGYLKEMDKLAPKGSVCTGRVIVKNVNQGYFYQAFVDCGEAYQTMTLSNYVKGHVNTVSYGAGLYANGDTLIYRGENPNNYLKLAGRIYRIVQFNGDGSIQIIETEKGDRIVWDNRYNQERGNTDGINDYTVSRVRDSLLTFVNSTSFTDQERSMLEPYSLCIGKVGEEQEISLGVECAATLDNQVIGLLPVSSYLYASLDASCKTPSDGTCQNYNYLGTDYNWWTLTADAAKSYKVYIIQSGGSSYSTRASANGYAREVLRLTENTVYVSGNGSSEDPYIIK